MNEDREVLGRDAEQQAQESAKLTWSEQLMAGLKECGWFKGSPEETSPVITPTES